MKILRRNFMIQALALPAVSVLLARFLAACGSNSPSSAAVACSSGFTASSNGGTSSDGHTHTITVPKADITAGSQVTYTTSTTEGHSHSVTLTAADMVNLAANKSISENSTTDSSHYHGFVITCI